MTRRNFISLLSGAVVGWPLAARAQQPKVPVIGFLGLDSASHMTPYTTSFDRGLNETGFAPSRSVAIEYRWAEGQYDRLPTLAADLVRRQVAVIFSSGGTPPIRAAMAATNAIPIIFSTAGDPVKQGLVSSMNRPGRQRHRGHLYDRSTRGQATGDTARAGSQRPRDRPVGESSQRRRLRLSSDSWNPWLAQSGCKS